MLGACLFAALRGRRAEQLVAAALAVGWVGSAVSSVVAPDFRPPLPLALIWDLLPALALLYGALGANGLWLGAALIAQGAQLGLRIMDLTAAEPIGTPVQFTISMAVNVLNLVLAAALAGSTLSAMRARETIQPA